MPITNHLAAPARCIMANETAGFGSNWVTPKRRGLMLGIITGVNNGRRGLPARLPIAGGLAATSSADKKHHGEQLCAQ